MELKRLVNELATFLQVDKFQDYCPNGLQVQGNPEVKKIISGVTASQALIDRAIEEKADAILVHHGYFWRGEAPEIVGMKQQRIKALLMHDMSLLAYHLPLDAHAQVGNNVQLGKQLGWDIERYLDQRHMVPVARLVNPLPLTAVAAHVHNVLGRPPLMLGEPDKLIRTVAWCTGAAQQAIQQCDASEVDLFISGEVSEQTTHSVREQGVAYLAAGHHATERYGVQALGAWCADSFAIEHHYVEIDNPI